MLVALKRWRVTSSEPLTCGPSAACAPPTAASARARRACTTFRFGLPASARSIRPLSVASSNARHQSPASVGVAAASAAKPTLAGAIGCATGAMPALLAQPLSVSTRLEAIATAIAATVGNDRRAR